MKLVILLLVLAIGFFTFPAFAIEPSEFGYKILPEKLLENTEGILQVYVISNSKDFQIEGIMIPKSIPKLTVTSSNSEIIKIIGIEENQNNFVTEIKIKALKPGIANIAMAASGFTSKEIPITLLMV